MRSAIEATLISGISIVLTVLIVAVILPRHALGSADPVLTLPTIQAAVFVDGLHERPGSVDRRSAPQGFDRAQVVGCPYLAAQAAASRCPVVTGSEVVSACPYLRQQQREDRGTTTQTVTPHTLEI